VYPLDDCVAQGIVGAVDEAEVVCGNVLGELADGHVDELTSRGRHVDPVVVEPRGGQLGLTIADQVSVDVRRVGWQDGPKVSREAAREGDSPVRAPRLHVARSRGLCVEDRLEAVPVLDVLSDRDPGDTLDAPPF